MIYGYFFANLSVSFTKSERAVETTDSTTAARIAASQFSIRISFIKSEAIHKITAFTTKVNSPRVKKFNGAVKISKIGLMNVLITPSTIAAKIAVR